MNPRPLHPAIILSLGIMLALFASCGSKTAQKGTSAGDILVTADSSIDLLSVRVEWYAPDHDRIVVYANGKSTQAVLPAAGSDAFDVYLGLNSLGGGGIDRADPSNRNSFHFHIARQGRSEVLEFRASGPDSANNYFLKRYVRDMQGNVSRTEYYDLQGRKSWETYDKLTRQGELEARNRIEYAYDAAGHKASQNHIASLPDGTVKSRIENTYAYDAAGREQEQVSSTFDGAGLLRNRTVNRFTYDGQGRMKEKEFIAYGPAGEKATHYITDYAYNDQGLVTAETLYTGERVKINLVEKRYNELKTVVAESITEYFPDGRVKSHHGREYDNKGKGTREF